MSANKTHIVILIDRSGSMQSIAGDVIGGYNQFLRGQQANGDDARVTFVQFDSQDPQEVIVAGAPISEVVPLSETTFVPRGGTPLLDATGRLITRISANQVERRNARLPDEDILFVTITDGDENQSCEFTLDHIRRLIAEKTEAGWTFAFLSAALDAYGDAQAMGIRAGAIQAFAKDRRGVDQAFVSLDDKASALRKMKRERIDTKHMLFFGNDKPAEDDRNRRGPQGNDPTN
jgi:Mg-chelatase subunit ChlD